MSPFLRNTVRSVLPQSVRAFVRTTILSPQPKAKKTAVELHVPADVLALRTEANLSIVNPWFEKSLQVPGDVVEFGCFRGTMSIKYAHCIKAMGLDKMVYAFDTFEGFKINDPAGGPMGIGSYSDNDNS
jgi:hypothetical protein